MELLIVQMDLYGIFTVSIFCDHIQVEKLRLFGFVKSQRKHFLLVIISCPIKGIVLLRKKFLLTYIYV